MDGGEAGGEAWQGDVVGQEVEFGDVVPDLGFGGELNKSLAGCFFPLC